MLAIASPTYPPTISPQQDLQTLGISEDANLSCPLYPQCLITPGVLGGVPSIPAGRYTYVLRTTNSLQPLVLRRYDRGDNPVAPCYGYRAFDTPANYRIPGGAYSSANYQYARHPQLVGTPGASVFAAGELLVQPDNVVSVIGNESGHFHPDASSLTVLKNAIQALGIDIAPNLRLQPYPPGVGAETPCNVVKVIPQFAFNIENHTGGTVTAYEHGGNTYPIWWDGSFLQSYLFMRANHDWHSAGQSAFTPLGMRPSRTKPELPYKGFTANVRITVEDATGPGYYAMSTLAFESVAPSDQMDPGKGYRLGVSITQAPAPFDYCLTIDPSTPTPFITLYVYDPSVHRAPPEPTPCVQRVTAPLLRTQ